MLTYDLESWDKFYPECAPLFEEHLEIGELNPKMPLEIDVDAYARIDKAGLLQILVARDDGVMVGYCIFIISYSMVSKNILCGVQNLWFVTKEHRPGPGRVGRTLFLESIRFLKSKGVKNIYAHHWLRGESYRLGLFFETILGAQEIQHEYSLWIGD